MIVWDPQTNRMPHHLRSLAASQGRGSLLQGGVHLDPALSGKS
jgi:hypothetical protein